VKVMPLFSVAILLAACSSVEDIGKPPQFTPVLDSEEHSAMVNRGLPLRVEEGRSVDRASLWSGTRQSLLGDRRALQRGDILTVVIEIDERAEISNATDRSRNVWRWIGQTQRKADFACRGNCCRCPAKRRFVNLRDTRVAGEFRTEGAFGDGVRSPGGYLAAQ